MVNALLWFQSRISFYLSGLHIEIMMPHLQNQVTINSSPPSATYMRQCSDNGLSPVRCQAITWTNAGVLSIGLIGTNFNEIWIVILSRKCIWKCLLPKWQPSCPGGRWVEHSKAQTAYISKDNPPIPRRFSHKGPYWGKNFHVILSWYVLLLLITTKWEQWCYINTTLITRFMGPTWGPSGAGPRWTPCLASWTLLSG